MISERIDSVMSETLLHFPFSNTRRDDLLKEWRANAEKATCSRRYHESDAFRDIENRLSPDEMAHIISNLMQLLADTE